MKYIIITLFFISCKPMVGKECDFTLPSNLFVRVNKYGQWAIINDNGAFLGYSTRYKNFGFYAYHDYETMTFDDSCKAKGLAKKYLGEIDKSKFFDR